MTLASSVEQYFEEIRQNDRSAWLQTFSEQPGLLQVDPVGTPTRSSKEAIGACYPPRWPWSVAGAGHRSQRGVCGV